MRPIRVNRRLKVLPVARPLSLDFMTIDEVAAQLRCSEQHIRNLMKRNEITYVRVGANRVITTQEVAAFVERNTVEVKAS